MGSFVTDLTTKVRQLEQRLAVERQRTEAAEARATKAEKERDELKQDEYPTHVIWLWKKRCLEAESRLREVEGERNGLQRTINAAYDGLQEFGGEDGARVALEWLGPAYQAVPGNQEEGR